MHSMKYVEIVLTTVKKSIRSKKWDFKRRKKFGIMEVRTKIQKIRVFYTSFNLFNIRMKVEKIKISFISCEYIIT